MVTPVEVYSRYYKLPPHQYGEVRLLCPFHPDHTPSMMVNLSSGLYYCHACRCGGDMEDFVRRMECCSMSDVVDAFVSRDARNARHARSGSCRSGGVDSIPTSTIETLVRGLESKPGAMRYLVEKRGLAPATIKQYQLGFDGTRITVPIVDESGKLVNIRRYRPNGQPKWCSWAAGYGQARLFPLPVEGDDIILCEGEFDCLVARQNGFNAYTSTNGCSSFPAECLPLFKGKHVAIVYDEDEAGRTSAKLLAAKLQRYGACVKIVELGLGIVGGDVTDYFVTCSRSAEELAALIRKTPEVSPLGGEMGLLVPSPSFVDSYVRFASSMTDAPAIFHVAVALTILGASLGNRVWVWGWGKEIFPHLWTLILAPSGFYRKSTAMDIGLSILRDAVDGVELPDDYSREKLISHLSSNPSGILAVYEMGELLSKLGRDYMVGTKELLTQLYDSQPSYKRSTMLGSATICKPAISILAASTIDWLAGRVSSGDVRGGFLARWLYFPGEEKMPRRGVGREPDLDIRAELVGFLKSTQALSGPFVLEGDVAARYDAWVADHEDQVERDRLLPDLQGFFTRLATSAMKFAMLYEVAMSQGLSISMDAMEAGIALADYLKMRLVGVIGEQLITTKDGRDIEDVYRLIAANPGIDKAALLRQTHFSAFRLSGVLKTLVEAERVTTDVDTAGIGRRRFYPI